MAASVEEIVRDLVAKHFNIPRREVDLAMPMSEAPDSLKMSELVIALEEHFDVALDDREIAGARVLGDLVTMVSEKLAAAGRA